MQDRAAVSYEVPIVAAAPRRLQRAIRRRLEHDLRFDPPPGLRIGTVLPDLVLADLEGSEVSLIARLDAMTETLVVFWNPSCGFCRAMRDDLRALSGTRAMIIVSTGDVTTVLAEGFDAPTLLDPELRSAAKLEVGRT